MNYGVFGKSFPRLKEDEMPSNKIKTALILVILAVTLTSCNTSTTESPADVVEAYINALASQDSAQAVELSCIYWKEAGKAEVSAFEGYEVSLEKVDCTVTEEDEEVATVSCPGNYVLEDSEGQTTTLALDQRSYLVKFEDDAWKVCGYKYLEAGEE
jgi:hypothetical protein